MTAMNHKHNNTKPNFGGGSNGRGRGGGSNGRGRGGGFDGRGRGGGSFRGRGNFSGRGRGNFSRGGETRPGGFSKTGQTYLGKREKLKERRNYTSKVKSQYAKQLQSQGADDFTTTPDFYKEIFAEVDREKGLNPAKEEPASSQESEASPDASSHHSDSDNEVSEESEGSEGSDHETIVEKPLETKPSTVEVKHKPNPFKRTLEELEKQDKELEAIRKEAKLAKEKAIKDRVVKKRQRKMQTKKLLRRTKNGQPILADHLDHILSKLKNN